MKLYIEHQKFPKWVSVFFLAIVIVLGYIIIKTYRAPINYTLLTVTFIFILIHVFFLVAKLITEINEKGINIKFIPFHRKPITYNWDDIKSCEIREYNPMLEFLGWGIRYGFSGKSYTVKGNQGIQLELKNEKKVLIGTQKGNEIKEILKQYFKTDT